MDQWSQTPAWIPMNNINGGNQYLPQDGVTVKDMNTLINNLMYLKKYGANTAVTLSTNATVVNTTLILKSEEA